MPLTKDRNTPMRDAEQIPVPLEGGAKIFAGAIVAVAASGFAVAGATAAGLTYLGRAENFADNSSGSDGDVSVNVRRKKAFKWKNSNGDPVTQALFGQFCFIVDDETVSATDGGGTQSIAGVVVGVEPDGIWVEGMPLPF
ncbi:MAG: hypothetical protein HWE39_12825 [Oceanospirillaceae bacterium]|nr:hypothetical protein [Oceanospirillaceae bacterium]